MSKNETIFVRLLGVSILLTPLCAETTVGLLTSIESNAKVNLIHNNILVPCEPFGIIPLEKMMKNGAKPQECTRAIDIYYSGHPHDRAFGREHLHTQQSYHYETIKEGCVLYANGVESYSEMLLRNGLALIDPAFDQKEWNGKLKRAQEGAQSQKRGLHETQIREFCIKEEK